MKDVKIAMACSALLSLMASACQDNEPEQPAYFPDKTDYEMFLLVRGGRLEASDVENITSWSHEANQANTVTQINDTVVHIKLRAPNMNLWGNAGYGSAEVGDTVTLAGVHTQRMLYHREIVNDVAYGQLRLCVTSALSTDGFAEPAPEMMMDHFYTLDLMQVDGAPLRRIQLAKPAEGVTATTPTGWRAVYNAVPSEVERHLAASLGECDEMWVATIDVSGAAPRLVK